MKRAKSNRAASANKTQNLEAGQATRDKAPSANTLSPIKRWAFRAMAFVLLPLFLLGGTEAALRIAGYGYPTSFFKRVRLNNEDYLIENDKFGLRFFPPALARSPSPILMSAKKPAGTCRIFLFGESAAQGDPRPAYGAGRYLQAVLRERFPDRKFEVICVATTAINSHVILPIALECARYQGDIWIIYMGNNEMVGPFGAASIFGSQSPSWRLVRLGLSIQRTRVGQLLTDLARKVSGRSASRSGWGGMKMFQQSQVAPNDQRKEIVYRNFRRNLEDILEAGRNSGAKIILNTIAVNLKDCAPFASITNSSGAQRRPDFMESSSSNSRAQGWNTQAPVPGDTSSADWSIVETKFKEAVADEARGDLAGAAQRFDAAARLAPAFAELQFRWAECLLQLTNSTAAREHFQNACDADALPFRADSRINSNILECGLKTAARPTASHFVLFDAAQFFATNSPAGVPGGEAFYEHVHLNFDGNYRLARAWAEQVATLLASPVIEDLDTQHLPGGAAVPPASSQLRSGQAAETLALPGERAKNHRLSPDWPSQEVCERDLALTDWNRLSVLQDILQRLSQPPFTAQFDHEERAGRIRLQIRKLREGMNDTARFQVRQIYLQALQRAPDDHRLHENFAEFLELTGDLPEAVVQWQRVSALIPHHHVAWFQAGRLLLRQGKLPEAEPLLSKAVRMRPDLAEGWLELGKLHALQGRTELALTDYQRERALVPGDYRVYYHLGKALSSLNRRAEAIERLREAVRLKPDFWEAQYALGEELAFDGQIGQARAQFELVLRGKPDYAMAHLNLGVTLARQGDLQGAIRQFEQTKQLEPTNKLADRYLQQLTRAATKSAR